MTGKNIQDGRNERRNPGNKKNKNERRKYRRKDEVINDERKYRMNAKKWINEGKTQWMTRRKMEGRKWGKEKKGKMKRRKDRTKSNDAKEMSRKNEKYIRKMTERKIEWLQEGNRRQRRRRKAKKPHEQKEIRMNRKKEK